MYLYGFSMFAGIDKVVKYSQSDFGFSAGDLLKSGDEYFLVLGEEVSFPEQYGATFPSTKKLQLVHAKLLSKKTLQLLHWMVAEYYTVYRNVMKYFLPEDVGQLLSREIKKKGTKKDQVLHVFPDLWTMSMMVDDVLLKQSGVVMLSSADSQNKKDKAFWDIKRGNVQLILTTHAELFQDFSHLQKIIFVDPHKWYYTNQQDPRYKTPDVVQKLADIWGVEIVFQ